MTEMFSAIMAMTGTMSIGSLMALMLVAEVPSPVASKMTAPVFTLFFVSAATYCVTFWATIVSAAIGLLAH